ncbi:MAG: DUF2950 domain-containing protein [Acidobacteriota bacterium]|nr:DUF2950 domain-containing protein [Acidobacteriota bacterium]
MILIHRVQNLLQHRVRSARLGFGLVIVSISLVLAAGCGAGSGKAPAAGQEVFNTPEEAAEAFILASETFDVATLTQILGPGGVDLVDTGDPVQDRNQSEAFAMVAREKTQVIQDPDNPKIAFLWVGVENWPVPIPIVEDGGRWFFDTEAGREELLNRRIGRNELDAIEVCVGFVEAQYEYASVRHDGVMVNQYAQRIVSTPGTQDGLAWQAPDGTWQGPVGEAIAMIIAEGYEEKHSPFHGYYFKVLKGQGPAAPFGEIDFLVKGAMIGGFALAAAPADYGVAGVKTFIVSHTGIVYEQDLGPDTLEIFREMELYNPDSSWDPVLEE